MDTNARNIVIEMTKTFHTQFAFIEPTDRFQVIWEKLDRLLGNANKQNEAAMNVFLEEFAAVEEHLSLVFHRYMEQAKGISIYMNGNKLRPWDPFMKQAEGGQLVAKEELDKAQVKVKCYDYCLF